MHIAVDAFRGVKHMAQTAFRRVQKFASPDGSTSMIVSALQGKKGINIKATQKGVGKGSARAVTGGRANVDSEKEATDYFNALCEGVEKRGWKKVDTRVKNAFNIDAIPAPPKGEKAAETHAHGGKKK